MITSVSNQQIKHVSKLMKSSRERREQGVFPVEGIRMFKEIPREDMVKFYVTEEFMNRNGLADEWQEGIHYEIVTESVFKEISDTRTPQGVLAIVKRHSYRRENILKCSESQNIHAPCVLLLENLQDPGNLGTILRTAEGAGVTGIMMSRDTVDIYNPKVVRATMGAIFRVPFVYEEDIVEGAEWLKQQGITCYAAHLDGTGVYEQNYKSATCFFIGNEGNGLTDKLTECADRKIKIPMMGQVESLNAATAATVLIYECMRQRL